MSFRESVIIPYALFKKCQFATPPAPTVPLPPLQPKKEPTPDRDEPPAPPNIETPPLPPLPPSPTSAPPSPLPAPPPPSEPKWPKKQEKEEENNITKMARVVPEEDRPIVQRILEQVQLHPRVLGWTDKNEVAIDQVVYPKSNILDILKFIMKKQVVENNAGAPFGAKDFVDNLINKIKIPKDWIKAKFVRSSKRKQRGVTLEDDEEEENDRGWAIRQPVKRSRSQIGSGLFPWITY